jgi:hypothetical protein
MPSCIVAQKESEQCLAFSRNNHRRCRLRRLYGQRTCNTHKNYYPNWFTNHQPWYRVTWLSERELAEWQFQLARGYVDVPEVYVRGLQGAFVDYYRFLVTVARIPVEWNTICLDISLKTIVERMFTNEEGAEREIKVFLNTPRDCIVVFQHLFYIWIQHLITLRRETGGWIPYMTAYDILRNSLHTCEEWRQVLYSIELEKIVTRRATILHVPGSLLNNIDTLYIQPLQRDLLQNFKLVLRSNIRRRLALYHEELIQVTWHPNRVAAMLEAGEEPWDI